MKEYLSEVSQVMAEQKTRPEGLSSSEAAERLQKHGPISWLKVKRNLYL